MHRTVECGHRKLIVVQFILLLYHTNIVRVVKIKVTLLVSKVQPISSAQHKQIIQVK